MLYSYDEILQEELNEAGERIAELIEGYARRNHRYITRTGNLEQSTYADYDEYNGINAYVDLAQADYGEYIINGFKTWYPDTFLDDAIEDNLNIIDEEITAAEDRAWDRYLSFNSVLIF